MRARPGFRLYLISDGEGDQPERIECALGAVPRGSTAIQLRAPALPGRELHGRALALRALTSRLGAALFVNDRLDVALAVGADGAQLPVRGLPSAAARRVAPDLLLSASTHSLYEARAAIAGGADLVTFGPIWPTASHPDAAPLGEEALATAVRALAVPVFALGGVDADTAPTVAATGAGAACLRAVLDAADPAAAAHAIAAALGIARISSPG